VGWFVGADGAVHDAPKFEEMYICPLFTTAVWYCPLADTDTEVQFAELGWFAGEDGAVHKFPKSIEM